MFLHIPRCHTNEEKVTDNMTRTRDILTRATNHSTSLGICRLTKLKQRMNTFFAESTNFWGTPNRLEAMHNIFLRVVYEAVRDRVAPKIWNDDESTNKR